MANVGHPFSVNSLTKYFKNEKRNASYETVLNYVKACENAFLLYRVKREDLVGKKSLSVNENYTWWIMGSDRRCMDGISRTSTRYSKISSVWKCCAAVMQ